MDLSGLIGFLSREEADIALRDEFPPKVEYRGMYSVQHQREGMGTFCFEDKSTYSGVWEANLPNGLGIFHHRVSGRVDAGFFKNGYLNGIGRIFFPNGSFYYGGFKEGKMHGTAVFYNATKRSWSFSLFKENAKLKTITKGQNLPPPSYCTCSAYSLYNIRAIPSRVTEHWGL
jgi:hypothetical protein